MELFKSLLTEKVKNAATLIVTKGYASTSLLCREMNIPYNESAEIMESLEALKIVSDFQGSKSRQILVNKNQLQKILNETPSNHFG